MNHRDTEAQRKTNQQENEAHASHVLRLRVLLPVFLCVSVVQCFWPLQNHSLVAHPLGHALAIEIFEQRDRVLAAYAGEFLEFADIDPWGGGLVGGGLPP